MLSCGAVPLNGFWNTRPNRAARRYSGQYVMSRPARRTVPRSKKKEPATAFSNVDLPEPLVPMTTVKDPSWTLSVTPWRALTSFTLPGWKVLRTPLTSSMGEPPYASFEKGEQFGHNQSEENKGGRDQLQVVRVHAPAQGDGDQQPEQHRTHHGADDGITKVASSHHRLADNDARQAPDNHADTHLHIGEPLILRQQGAREGDESVGDRKAEDDHLSVIRALRSDHLCIVAGGTHDPSAGRG